MFHSGTQLLLRQVIPLYTFIFCLLPQKCVCVCVMTVSWADYKTTTRINEKKISNQTKLMSKEKQTKGTITFAN